METTIMKISDSGRVNASEQAFELVGKLSDLFNDCDTGGVSAHLDSNIDLSRQLKETAIGRDAVTVLINAFFSDVGSIDHEVAGIYETPSRPEDVTTNKSENWATQQFRDEATTVVEADVTCGFRNGDATKTATNAIVDHDRKVVTLCRLYLDLPSLTQLTSRPAATSLRRFTSSQPRSTSSGQKRP